MKMPQLRTGMSMVAPLSMLLPTLASHHSTLKRSPGLSRSSCFFTVFSIKISPT